MKRKHEEDVPRWVPIPIPVRRQEGAVRQSAVFAKKDEAMQEGGKEQKEKVITTDFPVLCQEMQDRVHAKYEEYEKAFQYAKKVTEEEYVATWRKASRLINYQLDAIKFHQDLSVLLRVHCDKQNKYRSGRGGEIPPRSANELAATAEELYNLSQERLVELEASYAVLEEISSKTKAHTAANVQMNADIESTLRAHCDLINRCFEQTLLGYRKVEALTRKVEALVLQDGIPSSSSSGGGGGSSSSGSTSNSGLGKESKTTEVMKEEAEVPKYVPLVPLKGAACPGTAIANIMEEEMEEGGKEQKEKVSTVESPILGREERMRAFVSALYTKYKGFQYAHEEKLEAFVATWRKTSRLMNIQLGAIKFNLDLSEHLCVHCDKQNKYRSGRGGIIPPESANELAATAEESYNLSQERLVELEASDEVLEEISSKFKARTAANVQMNADIELTLRTLPFHNGGLEQIILGFKKIEALTRKVKALVLQDGISSGGGGGISSSSGSTSNSGEQSKMIDLCSSDED
jgi:hypothetical protein